MKENIDFENHESEPKHNIVTAFFFRHGQSPYLENNTLNKEELMINGEYPSDLTPKGEEEVKVSAERIADKVNKENDVVIFWSSPAWRAQGSENIIRKELEKRGVTILRDSSVGLMKYLEQYDQEYTSKLWKDIVAEGKSTDLAYARDPILQEKNDKFETQQEVKKRAELVFGHIRYLAEHSDLKGKRLCIIGASHFEFLNPIMEDIFGPKIEKGEGIKKGEEIVINFDYNPSNKDLKIDADFRGEHKDNISFDKDKLKFDILKFNT